MTNISNAFTFPFKDPSWVTKLLIGAIFTFLSILMIGIPVLFGYYVELLQRVRRREPYPLPEWTDVGVKFITGVKYLVTLFVYYLPVVIVLAPVVFLLLVVSVTGSYLQAEIGSAAFMVIILLIVLPYSLFIALLTPIISITFATDERIGSGLRLGFVLRMFRQYWQESLISVLITLGVELLAGIGILFFVIGILITSFYASLVQFHLYGQIGQSIDESTGQMI
jgi:hypothetical protein